MAKKVTLDALAKLTRAGFTASEKKFAAIARDIADMVAVFGTRFDRMDEQLAATEKKLTEKIDGVDSKVAGTNRRLDAEALERTDLKMPRRVHDLEEEVYGTGRSKHPKHLPL